VRYGTIGGEGQAMAASQKLSQLLQLADQGPALRAALAEEVAELLSAWPLGYPESMREICEALLAKAAHDVDAATRARLRVQLQSQPDLTQRVLPQEGLSQLLLEAARAGQDLVPVLAAILRVDEKVAGEILRDESGAKLAAACKGARMDRATFSALALLTHPAPDRSHAFVMLDTFDTMPASEASRRLHDWQHTEQPVPA
jgi:hypothetical protein